MKQSHGRELPKSDQPGKTRTWWHPLLVNLLRHELGDSCEVVDEVNVGQLPLRLDVVLIRREKKRLPQSARRHLPNLSKRLNRYTLLELKSPVDLLDRTDLDKLLACAHLWRAQQSKPIDAEDMSLIILAPKLTRPFERDLHRTAFRPENEERGVHRIIGTAFAAWVVETDILADLGESILPVFSRLFLTGSRDIMHLIEQHGGPSLLAYVFQQIQQFHFKGEDFRMQHAGTAYLDKTYEELRQEIIESASAKERLKGLSPEDLLSGLSPQARKKLRDLLDQQQMSSSRKRRKR